MFYYKIYDLNLTSDLSFPQLMPGNDGSTDVEIISDHVNSLIPSHSSEISYDFSSDASWLENRICYLLIQNGNKISYQLKPGGNEIYLRTYILGWGMSMLAMQRNEAAMHCSAVSNQNGAFLFCGESGSGKSTLTNAYLTRGYQLMADDMALVEYDKSGFAKVKAAFPYQKLCRDAALRSGHSLEQLIYIDEEKDKFLVPCHDIFNAVPKVIKGMIILIKAPVTGVQCQKLQGLDVFHACANNLFMRHLLKENKYAPQTGSLCLKIASCVPVYVILRPDGVDTTQEVIQTSFSITEKMEEL